MALVKCPECGRENVSDEAIACPSCGYNIKKYYEKSSSNNDENTLKYDVVLSGYYENEVSARYALKSEIDETISPEEAISIFENAPYKVAEYDTEEEARIKAEKIVVWGVEVYIVYPDGTLINIMEEKTPIGKQEVLNADGIMKFICFIIPLIGLIMYCLHVSTSPYNAKKCLQFAGYGFLVEILVVGLLISESLN